MTKLDALKQTIVKVAGRKGLLLKKHSPEILLVSGVTGVVVGTVLACRATLKAGDVIDNANEKLDTIKQAREIANEDEYSKSDYQKDLAITYVQTAVEFAKLYGPAVFVSVASISCIVGSHNIMKRRNIALMAAYKAIETSFTEYRKRVVDEFGADKDRDLKYGIKRETNPVTIIGEDGKKIKVKETTETTEGPNYSEYARFFDESSPNWSKTPEYNFNFVKMTQDWMNDRLRATGHVFLNEVYDALGIPRTSAGQVVGWIYNGEGDSFIDFGLWEGRKPSSRDFVNGYERTILLDFNVDGVIYDLI